MSRADYGAGSVHQRSSDGRWIGALEAEGDRRRITASAKTEAACWRKLREKKAAMARGEVGTTGRVTVKQWAQTYLAMRERALSPKGCSAAAGPIRRHVVPTIGRRRLDQFTPGDVRAVRDAVTSTTNRRGEPNKLFTAAATHRALLTMLNTAVAEGHHGVQNVAEVAHPAGRPFHAHECRNLAATMLLDAGVDESIVIQLLGHSTVAMTRRYRTRGREPLQAAMEQAGALLRLPGTA